MKRLLKACAVALAAFAWSLAAMAGDLINADEAGLGVKGYDPVAYFTEGRPTPGTVEHEVELHGVRWRFADAGNMNLFLSDPEAYMPRYGGFCSGAMARGFKATIDPEAFAIIDGRLYLAYDRAGIGEFRAEATSSIPAADRNWQTQSSAD